jgi:hypothetical protein
MLEFRDAASEKWMMNFENYKEEGFEDGLWTNYIEKMIQTEKEEVEVHMKPNSALLRGKRIPPGANIVFQYFMDLGTVVRCSYRLQHACFSMKNNISTDRISPLLISSLTLQSRGRSPIRLSPSAKTSARRSFRT